MKTQLFHITKIALLSVFTMLVTQFGLAQGLDGYIQEAQQNNPEIQAVTSKYKLSEEKEQESLALPNTTVSAGYFISEPETRTGAQKARFSIAQQIPWFGTLSTRQDYAASLTEAEYINTTIAKRKLALSVSQSYYQLYFLQKKEAILDAHISLLQTYEELALNAVEVAKASAVDVLKLQIRQHELQQKKEIAHDQLETEKNTFTRLLNQKESQPIQILDTLIVPTERMDLSQESVSVNPELLRYDALSEAVTFSEKLNQKQRQPGLGIGLDYIPVAERPDMNITDNGKDIVMPMVSLSIPIFNRSFKSVSKQNQLKQQQLAYEKNAHTLGLRSQLDQAKQQVHEAFLTYHTQIQNRKQAHDAEEILLKNYETGTIDFNDILDIQSLQLDFQLQQIEAATQYYKQWARIHYLID